MKPTFVSQVFRLSRRVGRVLAPLILSLTPWLGSAAPTPIATPTDPAIPGDPMHVFGLVGITRAQTARLHFVNVPMVSQPVDPIQPSDPVQPADPMMVQLQLLDSAGQPFLNADGFPIIPSDPIMVMPGETATLEVPGYLLDFPEGAKSMLIQPRVPLLTHAPGTGIATFELEDTVSGAKLAARLIPSPVYAQPGPGAANGLLSGNTQRLGPVSLQANETARLSVTTISFHGDFSAGYPPIPPTLDARLRFRNVAGAPVGTTKIVDLAAGQSNSLELSGQTFTGTILGVVERLDYPLNFFIYAVTLEVLDTTTGQTKLVLTAP